MRVYYCKSHGVTWEWGCLKLGVLGLLFSAVGKAKTGKISLMLFTVLYGSLSFFEYENCGILATFKNLGYIGHLTTYQAGFWNGIF